MMDPRLQAQINKLISRIDTQEKLVQDLRGYIDQYKREQKELWGKMVPQSETAKIIVLDGDLVLDDTMPVILAIDPGGSDRTVTAPPPSINNHPFILINLADADEELNLEDVEAVSLVNIGQDQQAMLVSDGETWVSAGSSTGGDVQLGGKIVIDPGSDKDAYINLVKVTGNPYQLWDESENKYYFSKGIYTLNQKNQFFTSGGGARDVMHFRDTTDTVDIFVRYDGDAWELRTEAGGGGNLLMVFADSGKIGIGKMPNSALDINLTTEDLEFVNAGSAGATELDWIQVEVGGATGYIRVYAAK